ncbi:MAG: CDP-glycerol glycerophosphotransferase family protein [bacterium]|nr:CDP-glycerol glycerophosphotransferase family protein [bacterium]
MRNKLETLPSLSKDEALRIAYSEGREDLFRTKLFHVERGGESEKGDSQKQVLIIARDPSGGDALAPVMTQLQQEPSIDMQIIADGRAEEIFRARLSIKEVSPTAQGLKTFDVAEKPNLLLICPSEEPGIEMSAIGTYHEVPSVLIDVYYGDSLRLLKKIEERGFPMPAAICTLDDEAKRIIVETYPALAERIYITGLPSFDRFASEDTQSIAEKTRTELGIAPHEKVVVFMGTINITKGTSVELVRAVVAEFKKIPTPFSFIFRKHPRDNTPYEAYRSIIEEVGIRWIDTDQYDTRAIGAAADMVLTTTSTEGIRAIYRRKPSIHINDVRYQELYPGITLPLPPVKLGASAGTEDVAALPGLMEPLFDSQSTAYRDMRHSMESHYPCDGKNAQRVVDVIKGVLARK